MTELRGPFIPNREGVAAKVIDGELIIIRLSDGTYYSMDNVGTRVWELIEGRQDLPGIIQAITSWYDGTSAGQVERDVGSLVQELLVEQLILAADGDGPGGATEAPPIGPLAYETPRLNIYRDMGNLLALDPPTPGIDDLLFKDEKPG